MTTNTNDPSPPSPVQPPSGEGVSPAPVSSSSTGPSQSTQTFPDIHKNNNGFNNPYAEIPLHEANRIQCNISNIDYLLVKLIRPGHGTIRAVMGTLWSRLCTSLRSNDILDNSKQNEFERFVSTCTIIDTDTYNQLVFESAQWRQLQVGAGNIAGADSSGQNGTSGRPVSKTGGRNVRKRAA